MFKHYFELMDGVEIYPLFSLLLFFVFFVIVTIKAIKTDSKLIKEMEELPLDED